MKKHVLVMLSAVFLFASCETLGNMGQSNPDASSGAKSSGSKYKRESVDETVWDLSVLDTARDADYMDEIEKDIILEMNMARSNPKICRAVH